MLREFGAGMVFETGTPQHVIEMILERSYNEAVNELPILADREVTLVPGPNDPAGTSQAWGWHVAFESEEPPSNSIYELTKELRQVEENFKAAVRNMLEEYNKTTSPS